MTLEIKHYIGFIDAASYVIMDDLVISPVVAVYGNFIIYYAGRLYILQ